jgi:hypothetical protein
MHVHVNFVVKAGLIYQTKRNKAYIYKPNRPFQGQGRRHLESIVFTIVLAPPANSPV